MEYIWTCNHYCLDSEGKSPYMKVIGVDSIPHLCHQHPWECLVYVLEAKLQSNPKGLPKWIRDYALASILVILLSMLDQLPWFLILAQDMSLPSFILFLMLSLRQSAIFVKGTVPRNWKELVESSSFSSTEQQYSLTDTWLNENSLHPENPASTPHMSAPSSTSTLVSEGASKLVQSPASEVDFLCSASVTNLDSQLHELSEFVNFETAGLRRSSHQRKQSSKATEIDRTSETKKLSQFIFFSHFGGSKLYCSLYNNNVHMRTVVPYADKLYFSRSIEVFHRKNTHFDGTLNAFSTWALAALNDSNDVYTYHDILKEQDNAKFIEAMIKEVQDHEERRYWICVPCSCIPKGTSTIFAI